MPRTAWSIPTSRVRGVERTTCRPAFTTWASPASRALALDSPDGWLPIFRLESTDQLFFEHPTGACFEIKVVVGQ